MSDYESQFQADLERAQALSLETLAFEQCRQQRRPYTGSISKNDNDPNGTVHSNANEFPQPIPPPPRRPARRPRTSPYPPGMRSTSNSPTPCEDGNADDLISFNTPSSVEKMHMELKEHVNRLHQQIEPVPALIPSQTIPKISRSNSSVLSYSAQNMYPYSIMDHSKVNSYASNPYIQNVYRPEINNSTLNQLNSRPKDDFGESLTFITQTNLYPDLSTVQNDDISECDFNNFLNSSRTTVRNNISNKNTPQLNTVTRNQTNTFYDHANTSDEQDFHNIIYRKNLPTSQSVDREFCSAIESDLKISSKNCSINSSRSNIELSIEANKISNVSKSTINEDPLLPQQISMPSSFNIKPVVSNWASTSKQEPSINLIDLATNASTSEVGNQQFSVLEAFDPLIADQNINEYAFNSECSASSIYEEYDPLDYIYSETKSKEPIYAVPNKQERENTLSPLPSPPPKSLPPQYPKMKRSNTLNRKLYETVVPIKTRRYESELVAFLSMIKDVRSKFVYSNTLTNPGYVVASKSGGKYPKGTSIKLLVHYKEYQPITFTCDVESTVEHIILHVVCELEGELKEDITGYSLRVWGMSEYLTSGSCLKEYNYVRQCVRLEKDVLLCLQSTTNNSLARSERDDTRDSHITLEQILPNQGLLPPISHHNLAILLETFEKELSRVVTSVTEGTNIRIGAISQAVKAICALLGGVETVHISTALRTLIHACNQQSKPDVNIMKAEILSDAGDYSNVSLRQATLKDTVGLHCQRLRDAVRVFISIYCRANRVDFELEDSGSNDNNPSISSLLVSETVLFCIEGIHRPPVHWNHDEYVIHSQIYYGTRTLKTSQSTLHCVVNTAGFYPRILFETWLNLTEIFISKLPKESRLVLTLSGRTLPKVDNQSIEKIPDTSQNSSEKIETSNTRDQPMEQEELGWSAIQLFDFDGKLVSGNFILPLWPVCADKRLGPAPDITDYPPQSHPLLHLEIPLYRQGGVHWKDCSDSNKNIPNVNRHSFESLDKHTQQQLMHLVEQGPHQKMPSECREILWEKRQYLVEIPGALPLVLLASVNWDSFSRYQLLQLLDQWKSPSPYDALHLLLPCFPDDGVRAKAVDWLSNTSTAILITLMPQLCLAIRYESHVGSRLTRLLLTRALESPRFAHRLYWQLVHDIPGNSPQNSSEDSLGLSLDGDSFSGIEPDESFIASSRWVRRNQIILRALLEIVGKNLAERLLKQQLLVKGLTDVANSVKKCKESIRNRILETGVNNLIPLVTSGNVCLPLSVSQELYDIEVKSCSYFPSNTLPLKISFISSDNTIIPAIFKVGDDLRQDSLVLQVMRIMDELWLKEGLDLSMVTFEAVPTQYRKGIIEMVCSAETLRSIQVEWGLTGSFKDKPIAEWLAKHNPSELEYERAVTNFTASCAGYSVATYLLGICDRHNDNIMLKTSGHLFHIDFGKFLGDAQMFGNFKRDRTPFVLTPDMAYVINGSEHPSQKFHHFVDLCCTAFNIIRKHNNLILNLFSLMASSGISGVSASSVGYVRAALLPGQSSAEAAATFARLIHSALKSKFTPINFFLHNLAQLRAGDQSATSNEVLSFMPKTYTMEQDGRIIKAGVTGFEKRYDPEKYYVYSLETYRQGQVTSSVVYRTYKHFTELYQKICLEHPLAKIHRLPVGLHMGRSNTKQAAERRFADLKAFINSLFLLADEISHSKLVYTFFHPLLRDQQDIAPQRIKNKNDIQHHIRDSVGAVKISVQYFAGVLSVLIQHARSLPVMSQNVPPSPYVKVYLVPDPSKETKRKTRVLKRNCHPSFMEMLEYRLPLEVIRGRDLQATVWHHDALQENQFLGGVCLPLHSMDLSVETVDWYPLKYIPR